MNNNLDTTGSANDAPISEADAPSTEEVREFRYIPTDKEVADAREEFGGKGWFSRLRTRIFGVKYDDIAVEGETVESKLDGEPALTEEMIDADLNEQLLETVNNDNIDVDIDAAGDDTIIDDKDVRVDHLIASGPKKVTSGVRRHIVTIMASVLTAATINCSGSNGINPPVVSGSSAKGADGNKATAVVDGDKKEEKAKKAEAASPKVDNAKVSPGTVARAIREASPLLNKRIKLADLDQTMADLTASNLEYLSPYLKDPDALKQAAVKEVKDGASAEPKKAIEDLPMRGFNLLLNAINQYLKNVNALAADTKAGEPEQATVSATETEDVDKAKQFPVENVDAMYKLLMESNIQPQTSVWYSQKNGLAPAHYTDEIVNSVFDAINEQHEMKLEKIGSEDSQKAMRKALQFLGKDETTFTYMNKAAVASNPGHIALMKNNKGVYLPKGGRDIYNMGEPGMNMGEPGMEISMDKVEREVVMRTVAEAIFAKMKYGKYSFDPKVKKANKPKPAPAAAKPKAEPIIKEPTKVAPPTKNEEPVSKKDESKEEPKDQPTEKEVVTKAKGPSQMDIIHSRLLREGKALENRRNKIMYVRKNTDPTKVEAREDRRSLDDNVVIYNPENGYRDAVDYPQIVELSNDPSWTRLPEEIISNEVRSITDEKVLGDEAAKDLQEALEKAPKKPEPQKGELGPKLSSYTSITGGFDVNNITITYTD